MGYKAKTTIDIPLDDLGDNNGTPFFVRIKNPRMLTFEEKSAFAKLAKIESDEEKAKAMQDVAKSFIVAWNLLDKEDEVLSVNPTDENALGRVPSEVVEAIFKAMAPHQDEETKNSSELSDNS